MKEEALQKLDVMRSLTSQLINRGKALQDVVDSAIAIIKEPDLALTDAQITSLVDKVKTKLSEAKVISSDFSGFELV